MLQMQLVTLWLHGERSQPAPDSAGSPVLQAHQSYCQHITERYSSTTSTILGSTCETVRTETAELVIVHLQDFQGWRKCWDVAELVVTQIQFLQKGQILDQITKKHQKCHFKSCIAWLLSSLPTSPSKRAGTEARSKGGKTSLCN